MILYFANWFCIAGDVAQSIYVVRDLPARAAQLRARLAKVSGHAPAKQTAEYPFALAEGLRAGTRQIIAYDFPRAIARATRIADDLVQALAACGGAAWRKP